MQPRFDYSDMHLFVMTFLKFATLQIGVVVVITILKIVLTLEMYSLFSFRRYSCFGSSCFLVPDKSRTKEDAYPSEGVKTI
jgi:hypothetical protein